MIIYKDVISGDELFTDSFPVTESGNGVEKVQSRYIRVSRDDDLGAALESETSPAHDVAKEDGQDTVIDIVHAHSLQKIPFDKKSYETYINGYIKRLKAKLSEKSPGRAATFEQQAAAHVKGVLTNFGDYSFYTGASNDNHEGMVIAASSPSEGAAPVFVFFLDGLWEEKM
ncbi:translationally-controlled tumor protein [Kitasatospora sp. NPDC004669]|uniref:translationally-controlled tumor protein n=1 Tax=Kitasatospora sp. NPDC004669 TaxID=3154555 RepID=UPI0033AAA665